MSIYYHGSAVRFDHFDLSHALEGDGKVKFGYGIYLTSRRETAELYARAAAKNKGEGTPKFVYTVEVPEPNDSNKLFLDPKVPVPADIVRRVEETLGEPLPNEAKALAKQLRRYLANRLTGVKKTTKQMVSKATLEGEREASRFFHGIGILYYAWPVDWKKIEKGLNIAVLSEADVRITNVEEFHD